MGLIFNLTGGTVPVEKQHTYLVYSTACAAGRLDTTRLLPRVTTAYTLYSSAFVMPLARDTHHTNVCHRTNLCRHGRLNTTRV